jgi:hypothetical protein
VAGRTRLLTDGDVDAFTATRLDAQRLATHVLTRARHGVAGRIDLTPTPGGFGTPAFGPDHRVLRLDGSALIVESTGERATTRVRAVDGATMGDLAAFAGVTLDAGYRVGTDTVELGEVDAALHIRAEWVELIGAWFALGVRILDGVLVGLGSALDAGRARIWPEHFDLGTDVATPAGRVNLGASAGDGFHARPYLYVGPWDTARPGDPAYWNAPFGAVIGDDEVLTADDPVARGVDFVLDGLARFR